MSSNECTVCGNFTYPSGICNDCRAQKKQMDEFKKQRARDAEFGSPWDVIRKGGA